MAKTHWKRLVNPDYLGAYALDDGQDLVLTIGPVRQETVVGNSGKKEECMVMRFRENVKPLILNKTNAKTITKIYGTPYVEEWQGKKIALYPDLTRLGSDTVECLRIRPWAPQTEQKVYCDECGEEIMQSGKMTAATVAAYTRTKYGKALCASCAMTAKAEKEAAEKAAEAEKQTGEKQEETSNVDM